MKRARLVAAALALVLAATVVGCAPGTSDTQPPPAAEISEGDRGVTQQIEIGQEIRLSLDANPTTGYSWSLDGPLPAQLKQVGEPTFTAQSDALGAGGVQVWTFAGAASGTGELKMKYWRSFEPSAPPADTFRITVDVK